MRRQSIYVPAGSLVEQPQPYTHTVIRVARIPWQRRCPRRGAEPEIARIDRLVLIEAIQQGSVTRAALRQRIVHVDAIMAIFGKILKDIFLLRHGRFLNAHYVRSLQVYHAHYTRAPRLPRHIGGVARHLDAHIIAHHAGRAAVAARLGIGHHSACRRSGNCGKQRNQ